MIEKSSQPYYYANIMGRNLLRALEEILGDEELEMLVGKAGLVEWRGKFPPRNLEREFSFDHISRLQTALEEEYGVQCGQGVALRCGRVFFTHLQRQFGNQVGLNDTEFRLLPQTKKMKRGLELLMGIFNQYSDQQVRLVDGEQLSWVVERCPLCWGRESSSADCHLMVGFLQEATYWISGGKHFHVEETACQASGDPSCVLVIDQAPIE
jgi:predicted hydrocarbon binding protein